MLRNKFPQYVRPTDEELSELLSSGIIVLDSSAILNLYRYSEETRDDFLELYEHEAIKPRLWMPHQVATEYMKNREGVRLEKHNDVKNLRQIIMRSTEDALKNAKKAISETGRGRAQHPHIDIEGLEENLNEGFETLKKMLDDHLNEPNGRMLSKSLDDDVLYTRIENLFGEQIGEEFSEQELEEIRKEGETRFRLEIPPGYEDAKSKKNPYGDLIIWKELIKHAAEQGKGIIFVTDDEKDDWIAKVKGQKVGPRLELIKEMLDKAGQRFYLYTGSNFHTYVKKLIKQEPRSESVEEAREVNQHLYENFATQDENIDRAPFTYSEHKNEIGRAALEMESVLNNLSTMQELRNHAIGSLGSVTNDVSAIDYASSLHQLRQLGLFGGLDPLAEYKKLIEQEEQGRLAILDRLREMIEQEEQERLAISNRFREMREQEKQEQLDILNRFKKQTEMGLGLQDSLGKYGDDDKQDDEN